MLWFFILAAVGAAGWLWWRSRDDSRDDSRDNPGSASSLNGGYGPSGSAPAPAVTLRDLVDAPSEAETSQADPSQADPSQADPTDEKSGAAKKVAKKSAAKKSTAKTTAK